MYLYKTDVIINPAPIILAFVRSTEIFKISSKITKLKLSAYYQLFEISINLSALLLTLQ